MWVQQERTPSTHGIRVELTVSLFSCTIHQYNRYQYSRMNNSPPTKAKAWVFQIGMTEMRSHYTQSFPPTWRPSALSMHNGFMSTLSVYLRRYTTCFTLSLLQTKRHSVYKCVSTLGVSHRETGLWVSNATPSCGVDWQTSPGVRVWYAGVIYKPTMLESTLM